jgi:hypothetical protein
VREPITTFQHFFDRQGFVWVPAGHDLGSILNGVVVGTSTGGTNKLEEVDRGSSLSWRKHEQQLKGAMST